MIFLAIWKTANFPIAITTLKSVAKVLGRICLYASRKEVDLADVFNRPILMGEFLRSLENPIQSSRRISGLINIFARIGEEECGFRSMDPRVYANLLNSLDIKREEYQQHAHIPTALYSQLLHFLGTEIADAEGVIGNVLAFATRVLKECGDDSGSKGRGSTALTVFPKNLGGSPLPALVQEFKLTEYFEKKDVRFLHDVATLLWRMQMACLMTILCYSGMRIGEGIALECDCLRISGLDETHIFEIYGTTTKFNNGKPYHVRWITSTEGARAIAIAKEIASWTWKYLPDSLKRRAQKPPLFLSVAHIPFCKTVGKLAPTVKPRITSVGGSRVPEFISGANLIISKDDLNELEFIDPHRAWRDDERFQVGKRWPFSSHQLRRSLALFASASGLVSFSSLRRQLKHITVAMTHYYARGATYAVDLVANFRTHFASLYQESQIESQYLSYTLHVVHSEEALHGPHGLFVQSNRKRGLLFDREKTLAMFKKGEMTFKETPLGGCAETGVCTKRAMRSVVACLDCSVAVIKVSKLERVVSAREKAISKLESGSISWRMNNE
ncbi:hypothetical protein, partial [Herbaspirillum sp. B65]|uniref:hypothetical protein n=1 Tax=Herbaspirillum sp. B65 TaxID=137708 RepID=UPI0005CACBF6